MCTKARGSNGRIVSLVELDDINLLFYVSYVRLKVRAVHSGYLTVYR